MVTVWYVARRFVAFVGMVAVYGEVGVNELNCPAKVRHVEKIRGESQDIVARLKATGLGRLYVIHLKQYPLVRGFAIRVWRNAYPLYINSVATHRLRNESAKRWRRLTTLNEFAKTSGIPTIDVADAVLVDTRAPKVFPAYHHGYLVSPLDRYTFPRIYVATVNDGVIYGGTNLILTKDDFIFYYDKEINVFYTSEELHGRNLIDPGKCGIRWLLDDEAPERIPVAAAFVDACAPNYAHWLTEVLPRIAAFCAEEQLKENTKKKKDRHHKKNKETLLLI